MLDLVKIEFLKQRHQKLNFVVYGVVSLYLALICYYVNDARGLFDSFPFVYKFSLSYLNFLILPLYCVSYTIQAFGVEYRYRIMNNLKLASANLMKTFWAKILYIEINALCIMLFTYISVSLFALLSRFSSTVSLSLLLRFFYLCMSSGIFFSCFGHDKSQRQGDSWEFGRCHVCFSVIFFSKDESKYQSSNKC